MGFAKEYIKEHFAGGRYLSRAKDRGCECYLHRGGWQDAVPDENLIFSYRCAAFAQNTFTNKLHAHTYFEMVIFVAGDVEYLTEHSKLHPESCAVIWSSPAQMHTAHLRSASEYRRYVICFDPDFFACDKAAQAILGFMQTHPNGALYPDDKGAARLLSLLQAAQSAAEDPRPFAPLLLRARVLEFFAALNDPTLALQPQEAESVPLFPVKAYIDRAYAEIGSVGEIAAHFFYSREHLSRRFREEFNIPVAEYLSKRRVLCSLPLLQGGSVAEAAFAVGFRSLSAYIAAFKREMGCLPSAYKA